MALCALVIIHHTAIAYGAMGGWCYVAPETVSGLTKTGLSTLLAVNQAFFMSLFFFISAYLMPHSFDKKGGTAFLKDRLVRLGIPLLVYTFLIHPTLLYGIAVHTGSTRDQWLQFIWKSTTRLPNTGHMWFVLTLLLFEGAYALYRWRSPFSLSKLIPDRTPTNGQVALFIVACAIAAFAIRQFYPVGDNIIGLQLGFFALYIAMYGLGIVAQRKQWMDGLSFGAASVWILLSLIASPLIAIPIAAVERNPDLMRAFIGGLHWQALALTLWESLVCVGLCSLFWVIFRKHWNNYTILSSAFAGDTYAVYIIHPVVLVDATMLFEPAPVPAFTKFVFVSALVVVSCYLVAHSLRRIPILRKVL